MDCFIEKAVCGVVMGTIHPAVLKRYVPCSLSTTPIREGRETRACSQKSEPAHETSPRNLGGHGSEASHGDLYLHGPMGLYKEEAEEK